MKQAVGLQTKSTMSNCIGALMDPRKDLQYRIYILLNALTLYFLLMNISATNTRKKRQRTFLPFMSLILNIVENLALLTPIFQTTGAFKHQVYKIENTNLFLDCEFTPRGTDTSTQSPPVFVPQLVICHSFVVYYHYMEFLGLDFRLFARVEDGGLFLVIVLGRSFLS